MEENQKTNAFKKLLERLQEDSWQLELLISGFAIFGLFYALEPIRHKLYVASFDQNQAFVNLFVIVYFALQVLIFNLLLHVVSRGLWIGSLGLRYVFGEIDYDQLKYSELFTNYLKKKVGSFDDYIAKLENFCSIIFAVSFLLVFYIFSFFIVVFLLNAFNASIPDWALIPIRILFGIVAFGAILVVIDFFTQGSLKKGKRISKIYFPFYWFYSLLTLSFLYRPLIYNLLDNKLGRRVSFVLIPFYVLVYVVFNLNYQKSNFITLNSTQASNKNISSGRNYADVIDKDEDIFIGDFSIQSQVITEPFLKISVPINSRIEDSLIAFNPRLKPKKDKRGLYFKSQVTINNFGEDQDHLNEEYIKSFEEKYRFKIDGKTYENEFVITNFGTGFYFESYIGIKDLRDGKYLIEMQSRKSKGKDSYVSVLKVPFWYYGE
ncbi:MAG: hypothetical protein WC044_11940 [Crocinitomicaceae bacterium]